jgi:two-component system, cell cycle sensor histidine kinase and response regulator CckA
MPSGRIMIVEDESLVAEDLNSILETAGFEVVGIADSFGSAEEMAEVGHPDIALLDIRLKGERDGIDLAHELRRRSIGFVYLTSHSDAGTLARAEVTEPLGYVLKPFGAREMLPVLQTAFYRHAAELRLRNVESWLRTVLHSIGDAVFVTDRDARVTYINPVAEALVGRRLRHATGMMLTDIAPVTDLRTGEQVSCIAKRAMEQGNVVFLEPEAELLRADKMRLPVEDCGAPIRDADGTITGAVVVMRDGTPRKRMEQQRLEAERRMQDAQRLESIGVVASGLAHDLGNVVTSILGNVSLCIEEGASSATSLREIENQALLAADLCNRMLAGARPAQPSLAAVELGPLVTDCINTERGLAGDLVQFAYEPERAGLQLSADAVQVRQVLQNLLRNACEAMGERGGGVVVRAGPIELPSTLLGERSAARMLRTGSYVWLEVCDDGPGMPDEVKARIFTPFFTTKSTGRGLGLASVMGIVHRHGAAMEIESALGVGTVFRLFWPAAVAAATAADRPTAPPVAGRTVLLVDDDDAVRKTTLRLLEGRGWLCHQAADGERALALLRAEPGIAAVVLDLRLQGIVSDKLLADMRAHRADLPVLLVSGAPDVPSELRLDERVRFLAKPFRIDELVLYLQQLIGSPR